MKIIHIGANRSTTCLRCNAPLTAIHFDNGDVEAYVFSLDYWKYIEANPNGDQVTCNSDLATIFKVHES